MEVVRGLLFLARHHVLSLGRVRGLEYGIYAKFLLVLNLFTFPVVTLNIYLILLHHRPIYPDNILMGRFINGGIECNAISSQHGRGMLEPFPNYPCQGNPEP